MRTLSLLLALLFCTNSFSQDKKHTSKDSSAIVIDHHSIDLFNQIPGSILIPLSNFRLVFRHASVGSTINDGLECIQGTRTSPVECTSYPDYKYDRRKWNFQPRPNSGWYGKMDDFVTEVEAQKDSFDIFTFKYCYLDGIDGLQEPCGISFNPQKVTQAWDYYRTKMDSLENAHPLKIFIWITIPLTQVGQYCTDTLNGLIRDYCTSHGKILFDLADIQCHDSAGALQTNAQGWQIAYKPFCGEQQPGAQACHPNWPGKIRIAKAFWWMMAQIYTDSIPSTASKEIEYIKDVKIFPNPTNNLLHIDLQNKMEHYNNLEIYSNFGKQIYKQEINSNYYVELRVGFLNPGIYLLKLTGKNKVSQMKFSVIK